MTSSWDRDALPRRNAYTALFGAGIVAVMTGLVVVSPTLYAIFCQVTGYGGTTQRAGQDDIETVDREMVDRTVAIRFDANTDQELPWVFRPKQREIAIKLGETGLAFYESRNDATYPVTGMATFNVTPLKAGKYFTKIHCFCFNLQTLSAGERVDMPVQFFVDPDMARDPNMDDVQTITLSYTFFAQDDPTLDDLGIDSEAASTAAEAALAHDNAEIAKPD